jgi:hypothetical protein
MMTIEQSNRIYWYVAAANVIAGALGYYTDGWGAVVFVNCLAAVVLIVIALKEPREVL